MESLCSPPYYRVVYSVSEPSSWQLLVNNAFSEYAAKLRGLPIQPEAAQEQKTIQCDFSSSTLRLDLTFGLLLRCLTGWMWRLDFHSHLETVFQTRPAFHLHMRVQVAFCRSQTFRCCLKPVSLAFRKR